jgi:hypothetical protein
MWYYNCWRVVAIKLLLAHVAGRRNGSSRPFFGTFGSCDLGRERPRGLLTLPYSSQHATTPSMLCRSLRNGVYILELENI